MADANNKVESQSKFVGGLSDFDKEGDQFTYAFGRSVDYRSNSKELTILPKTVKESGTVIQDLPKWADRVGDDTYIYGDSGNIYQRSILGSHTLMRTVSGSQGNGLKYYGEDDFVYYATNTALGRYGQMGATPSFTDDFLGSEGGVPLNTHSLVLNGTSQYATAADSASLSVTGNLTLEIYSYFDTLPSIGSPVTLMGKWNESGATRSYKLDLVGVSGYFGDGSDGALTVSTNTTDAPIDSACTGTSGAYTLSATNASFASGQVILIHQTRGTGAGTWQRNSISSYTAGTITLDTALNASYTSGAQVLVLKQYTDVTVNTSIAWTAKAWNGTVGGILAFLANGTVTVNGTITAAGKGFRGGAAVNGVRTAGRQGEGTSGAGTQSTSANGNGGGGGSAGNASYEASGGAGGGHYASGNSTGGGPFEGIGATGGTSAGSADLTTLVFGGGGGSGGTQLDSTSGTGGAGGGIVFIIGTDTIIHATTGSISVNGANGTNAISGSNQTGGGGGGAGGSALFKSQTATLNTTRVTAAAATGGHSGDGSNSGGTSSVGRNHIDYYTSYTGTTSPTIDATQDNSLVTNTTYQMRLGISDDGTAYEYLAREVNITTATWYRFAAAWTASTSTVNFYQDGVSLGSRVGTMTAIHDNASLFSIGANDTGSGYDAFLDGKVDDIRVLNTVRTASQIFANKDVEIAATTPGLQAYLQVDNSASDATANANNLTLVGTPSYSTSVPFASPTTRLDLDQSLDTSGNTYTLAVAIDEGASHRQTFSPAKDPQKSIQVLIAAVGTGNWTLTVHDSLNRTLASKTVANASLAAGDFEFIFDDVWRPIIGAEYHFHLTSTVADGTVTVTTASNLETADFHTYYQFLVSDEYHTITDMLNFLVIANERYVAKWDASTYTPHRLTFPAGYRVRCFAKWRNFLAIGCTRGDDVYDYDMGKIFFWDGVSDTYNDYIDVPEGSVNSMLASQGILHTIAGYQGDLLEYTGGDAALKVKRIPKMAKDKYVEVLPGAMNMWQTLLRIGVSGDSDSSSVERGVYTYGRFNKDQPVSFSYDYPISTGNRAATNIKIGLVFPVDRKLLVGWQDNTSYGIDLIDPAGEPFATATVEKLLKDDGGTWKEKLALTVRADFKALASGESVKLKYRVDRADTWTEGEEITTEDETKARLPIKSGRYKEIQYACDLITTTSTAPTLLELSLESDLLPDENTL